MKTSELKKKYIEFFKKHNHKEIKNFSLIPENDPTVLFTTAGMHPLVPFLIGQSHPLGKRLVNAQRCIRTSDINEVGDEVHLTFFEMLGNWSLGDYFKEEAIKLSYEFLTKKEWLNLKKEKLAVSCFKGDKDSPKDEESAKSWLSLGIKKERIAFLPKENNWWGPAGKIGPCGPDTEIFYWNSNKPVPKKFDPKNKNWIEIWNDVFMQYNKTIEGKYILLKQKNVDTGLGVERVAMILQKKNSVFEIDVFAPIVKKIKELSKVNNPNIKSIRKIADHTKTSVFILGDENKITPSNLEQGYVLRRLIRTSIRHIKLLSIDESLSEIAKVVIDIYKEDYPIY